MDQRERKTADVIVTAHLMRGPEGFFMKEWFVYILANKRNGTLYTGVTSDLPQRIWQHKNKFDPSSFTCRYDVTKLVYFEPCGTYEDAIPREKLVKKWKRKWKLALIEKMNPEWKDLSEEITF